MEENKILEFVREFNAGLENSNQYNNLQYQNDGFQEGLLLPNIYAWSDDEGSEFFKQKALSSLTKQLTELINVVNPLLESEINKFFTEKENNMKDKFTNTRLLIIGNFSTSYKVSASGQYNEDTMEQFLEVLEEDFKYIFPGIKISIES